LATGWVEGLVTMKISRRSLPLAGLATILPTAARARNVPLRLVIPYPPGGGSDLLGRAIGGQITAAHGRIVIIENRGGAGGVIGAQAVARSEPDGNVILQGDSACITVNPVANRVGYTAADFAPIARITTNPVIMITRADGPIRGLADVVQRSRAEPDALTCATSGVLSHYHVMLQMLRDRHNVKLLHVPYQGTPPGVLAVLSGQVDLAIVPPTPLVDGSLSGRLRGIGVMGAERFRDLPDIPTFREQGIDMVSQTWRGILAPRGTPDAVQATLEQWILEGFEGSTTMLQQIRRIGETPAPLDRSAFAAFLDGEREALAEVLRGMSPTSG